MKKILAFLMAMTMILSFAACGNGNSDKGSTSNSDKNLTSNDDKNSTSEDDDVSCQKIYEEISSVVKFPKMVFVQAKSLSNRYGIEQDMYSDYVFMTAQEATLCDTVIIINTTSQQNKEAVMEKLEKFINQSIETNVNYNPDQYAIIKNASVKTIGNFVYLVFSSDANTIEEMIKEKLS